MDYRCRRVLRLPHGFRLLAAKAPNWRRLGSTYTRVWLVACLALVSGCAYAPGFVKHEFLAADPVDSNYEPREASNE